MNATGTNKTEGGLPAAPVAGIATENATMNEAICEYKKDKCVWTNGKMLAQLMQSERKGWALSGFFFDYGHGETKSFRRYSKQVETAGGFMMGAARNSGCSVRIFKNMNGEIACSLKAI